MIIAITGKKNSGKTTLAELLVQHHKFLCLSFAEPIKKMLYQLLTYQGCEEQKARDLIWGDLKEEKTEFLSGQSSRRALQTLGTEWGRILIHRDLWTNAFKNVARNTKRNIVIDDLRFLSEAEAIRKMKNARIIKVHQDKYLSTEDKHISETEMDQIPVDLIIYNPPSSPESMLYQLKDAKFI